MSYNSSQKNILHRENVRIYLWSCYHYYSNQFKLQHQFDIKFLILDDVQSLKLRQLQKDQQKWAIKWQHFGYLDVKSIRKNNFGRYAYKSCIEKIWGDIRQADDPRAKHVSS